MMEKALAINNEKTIFWGLAAIFILAMGFYMYFINVTIHNTVARQNLESDATNLSLEIGNMEFKYISKRNNVTLALAHSLGYNEAKVALYVNSGADKSVAIR